MDEENQKNAEALFLPARQIISNFLVWASSALTFDKCDKLRQQRSGHNGRQGNSSLGRCAGEEDC